MEGTMAWYFVQKFNQNTMPWYTPFLTPFTFTIYVSFEYFTILIGELKLKNKKMTLI